MKISDDGCVMKTPIRMEGLMGQEEKGQGAGLSDADTQRKEGRECAGREEAM